MKYFKIEKSFLLNQYNKLQKGITLLENDKETPLDLYKIDKLNKLRNSFQDISYIISKCEEL